MAHLRLRLPIRALDRKLLRDLWDIKEQALAIAAVIACGVATFVMSLTTLRSLELTRATYYDRYRFADVFAMVKRAPQSLVAQIAEIPGVSIVETRVVRDVTLDVPGLNEPAVARLVSIPESREPALNSVYLRKGRYLAPGHNDEVLCSEGFANKHGFEPGDKLTAVINGRKKLLKIVGVALSPEFIYTIRAGDVIPDDKRFAVLWMGREPVEAAFDMDGAFNDVCLSLMPGAIDAEVIRRLDRLTDRYGGLGAYARADQVSDKFLANELQQLRGMALLAPTIFLSVAAFLLNVVLGRIIGTQREQIAALKAFGYTNLAVGVHYLKLVLCLTLVGVALGCVFGAWLGRNLTELYTTFYHFPVLQFDLGPDVIALGVLVSAGAAVFGTLGAVRKAVILPPAEAMRPEPPATYRKTLIERLGLVRLLSPSARMILRHLERQPIKAGMSSLGIALAVGMLILGSFSLDSIDYMMDINFNVAQRHDVSVVFVEPHASSTLHELEHLPGVMLAEPFRSVPVRVRAGNRSRRVALMGLESHARLQRLINDQVKPVPLPAQGLVLGSSLAERLGVRTGDQVRIEVLEGKRVTRDVPIVALVNEFVGSGVYMELRALNRLLREGTTVSGGYLMADSRQVEQLYWKLKRTPGVAAVTVNEAAVRNFQETIAENMLRMRFFNIMFAVVIACGVVYNSARIALAERARELASLRVLGFTRAEISTILLGELAVLTLAAIPLGMLIGRLLAEFVIASVDTELFRLPLIINASTYGTAVLVVVIAALVSGLIVRRKLDHLDLVSVLKTRD
jgi:putative ABC transport system permease protein